MDKHTWYQLTQEERTSKLRDLLSKLVEIDKVQAEYCKTKQTKPLHTNRFQIEQQILQILEWDKEEYED